MSIFYSTNRLQYTNVLNSDCTSTHNPSTGGMAKKFSSHKTFFWMFCSIFLLKDPTHLWGGCTYCHRILKFDCYAECVFARRACPHPKPISEWVYTGLKFKSKITICSRSLLLLFISFAVIVLVYTEVNVMQCEIKYNEVYDPELPLVWMIR